MAAAGQIAMDRQHLDSERRTAILAAPGEVAAQLRDHHDRTGIGLMLIGMPGIEKRLARFPQLYSQVGFVHHYSPLSAQEQAFVLARHWPGLHLNESADFTVGEAVAAITRLTGGNFPLTCRLVAQIQRLDISQLTVVTGEVVGAARESLVIGHAMTARAGGPSAE